MGAAEDRDRDGSVATDDDTVADRLMRIEMLLARLLRHDQNRRRSNGKRSRTVAQRAVNRARDTYQPTELEVASARKILARRDRRR